MLNKSSSIPLYQQLANKLRDMIEKNYKPGDMIPTESEIEKMFDVSRMTVRKAVDELVQDGMVEKRQGRGTFVKEQKITHNLGRITSWTEEMLQRGQPIETLSTDITEVTPTKRMRHEMQLEPGETMIRIKRLRASRGEPLSIMVNYLRSRFVPGFLQKGLLYESLYEMLEKEYNIRLEHAEETVEAREASELEAESLRIPIWSPVLYVTRFSFLSGNVPFELTHVTTRGDRYQYRVKLHGRMYIKE